MDAKKAKDVTDLALNILTLFIKGFSSGSLYFSSQRLLST